MTRAAIAGGACATALVLLAVAAAYRALHPEVRSAVTRAPAMAPSTAPPATEEAPPAAEASQGFLYGRITTVDGATYEGRLRWGGDQEAFWDDTFNGSRRENPWLAHLPPERLRRRRPVELFGIRLGDREIPIDFRRQLLTRFGEIARIAAQGREVRVTLKSGTVHDLDRLEASDFDDGVRVWDGERGVVDLDSLRIRAVEFLPTPGLRDAPHRLHGTVRTQQGEFTGFVSWRGQDCFGSDELHGHGAEGDLRLRFDTLRSIARRSRGEFLVTLLDGGEVVLSDDAGDGAGQRAVQVDDRRFGRVRISLDAFERVDLDPPGPGGSGLAYGDFPPGRPLTGSVTARDGRRFAGRLVYDLDESESSDTLDAQDQGVHYTIPFGLIAAIVPPGRAERGAARAGVILQDGGELRLDLAGDLGEGNAGLLIFVDGRQRPEYVPWADVERVDVDPSPPRSPARLK